jgi:Na+/H+-dicarboxylate symporter
LPGSITTTLVTLGFHPGFQLHIGLFIFTLYAGFLALTIGMFASLRYQPLNFHYSLLTGILLKPDFFRYSFTISHSLVRYRRHRSHFSFLSPRRFRRYTRDDTFTIFVTGASRATVPIRECFTGISIQSMH